ncbi:MAG: hypothetical protein WDW36_000113 [Sanguina aurantia]
MRPQNEDLPQSQDNVAVSVASLFRALSATFPSPAQQQAALLTVFAVDSFAVDSFAVDSSAVDASAVDAFAVDSFAVDSFAVDSFAVDSFAVDASAVDASAVDASAVDSFADVIAPVVNIFAAELNLAANAIVTVSGSILVSGNVVSIMAAVLVAQNDAYMAMLAAAVTSTVAAATPAIARSAALPPATRKTHVRSRLGDLRLIEPLQMAYAQKAMKDVFRGSSSQLKALDKVAAELSVMVQAESTSTAAVTDRLGAAAAASGGSGSSGGGGSASGDGGAGGGSSGSSGGGGSSASGGSGSSASGGSGSSASGGSGSSVSGGGASGGSGAGGGGGGGGVNGVGDVDPLTIINRDVSAGAVLLHPNFHAMLDAFLQGDFGAHDFSDPAFQSAVTAFLNSAAIVIPTLSVIADLLAITSGSIATTGAVISLEIAAALYVGSLLSLDLQFDQFLMTFEADAPANIGAAATLITNYLNIRAAFGGNGTALAASAFGQSADSFKPDGHAIVNGVVSGKAQTALESLNQARDLLSRLLESKAGQTIASVATA